MQKIAIVGAMGRMGSMIADAVKNNPDFDDYMIADAPVDDGTFDRQLLLDAADSLNLITPNSNAGNTDITVEFTVAGQSQQNVRTLLANGNRKILVGTSGWSESDIESLCHDAPENAQILIVPNFSISAVLQEEWTVQAAKYFQDAAIVEYHHKGKKDRPSGTALRLAERLESETGTRPEISSVRADGYMATQEVILTNPSERLIINQDVTDRPAFLPGIKLALDALRDDKVQGVEVGLQKLLGLC